MIKKIEAIEGLLKDIKQHLGNYDMRDANESLKEEEGIDNEGVESYSKSNNPDLLKKQMLLKKMQQKAD